MKREAKPLLAELLGTYVVVLCAAGAGVATAKITGTPNAMVCGLASGTALAIVIVLTAGISGAHVNPALTLALAHLGRFPWRSVAGYVAAQMAGSAAAGLTVLWVLGSQASVGANTPNAAMGISQPFAFLLEVFLSFVMMMVILLGGELSGRNLVPGALRIGAVVGIEVMLFGPISGAAMNPARIRSLPGDGRLDDGLDLRAGAGCRNHGGRLVFSAEGRAEVRNVVLVSRCGACSCCGLL